MRNVFYTAIALASCLRCEAAGNLPKCPRAYAGLKVQVEMRDPVLPRGQPIPVVVTLQNGSKRSFRLRTYMVPPSYWLDLACRPEDSLDGHGG